MDESLRNFCKMALEDPLFAAEGMDLERGSAALDGIEAVVSEIEEVCGKNSLVARLFFTRYPASTYALPIPFLRAFIESERSRRRFLSYPTMGAAHELLNSWEKTQENLAASVARYEALHKILYRLYSRSGSLSPINDMHGNITAPKDADKVLQLMGRNAKQLRREINERRMPLADSENKSGKKEALPFAQAASVFIPGEIPSVYVHLHRLECIHIHPFRVGTVLEKYGPLRYTLPHFDGALKEHLFMAYFIKNNDTSIVSLKISAVDNYLFLKIGPGAKRMAVGPIHESLVEKGFRYWYQSSTNFYTMRDQTYWADIATIIDFQRRPGLPPGAALQKSSLFDVLLGTCVEDHRMFLSNVREVISRTGRIPPFWFPLLFRTHPSIYYMPFNKSVWRLPEQPNFLGSGRAKQEDNPYLSADDILQTVAPEELELVMQGGRIREEERRKAGV